MTVTRTDCSIQMTVAEMKVNVKILSSKMYVYIYMSYNSYRTETLLKKARSTVHISARAQGLARVTELYVTD